MSERATRIILILVLAIAGFGAGFWAGGQAKDCPDVRPAALAYRIYRMSGPGGIEGATKAIRLANTLEAKALACP